MISRRLFAAAPIAMTLVPRAAWADDGDLVLPLDLSGPRPRIMLSIGDNAPEGWVFDTGAGGCVINIERARALGLPEGPTVQIGSPAGGTPLQGFQTTIANGHIGRAVMPEFRAAAIPLQIGDHAGVLSPNIFSGRLVIFDFARSEVRVVDRVAAPATAPTPYEGNGPHALPAIPVTVAGRTYQAHLDSGAPHTISFPYAMAQDLPLAAPPVQSGVARFVDGEHARYAAQLRSALQIGPLTLQNPEISMIDGLPFVNVGTQALRRMIVTLDPERRVSWAALAP